MNAFSIVLAFDVIRFISAGSTCFSRYCRYSTLNLPLEHRVADLAGMNLLEPGELLLVGQGVVEPVLGLLLGGEIFVLAGGVGVPPGLWPISISSG